MNICVAVMITGRVQGVWFRQNTKKCADQHGVHGWCQNNPDGSVEAVFAGAEDAVNAVVKWCKTGPIIARVDNVQVDRQKPTDEFEQFLIR
ncbi:MAG: acylphosphatase [Thermodesulfobacteriota bacterium]|nr:acylphosphatase [Thermodesulfobacteriota bacterium]